MSRGPDEGGGRELPPSTKPPIPLSQWEQHFHLARPTLKELIATRVLNLFSVSLIGTLSFAGLLVLVDSVFIFAKVITPEQRLVSEKVVMTFVTATVVQVGAALAAIVLAVFKEPSRSP